jgi:hypothetical protein
LLVRIAKRGRMSQNFNRAIEGHGHSHTTSTSRSRRESSIFTRLKYLVFRWSDEVAALDWASVRVCVGCHLIDLFVAASKRLLWTSSWAAGRLGDWGLTELYDDLKFSPFGFSMPNVH